MSYSSNPLLPKARKWAINLVLVDGLSVSQAARRAAVHRTTLWRWLKRWNELGLHGNSYVPTRSSRPKRPARLVSQQIVERIVYWRKHKGRCAVIVHAHCQREGTHVSLSTVRRVLYRQGLIADRRYKKQYRAPVPRPVADAPGKLVQTDTVHLWHGHGKLKTYLYTAVDVYSRWAYVEHHDYISQELSVQFLKRAQAYAGFQFACVQADNGAEFGRGFETALATKGTLVRHSRVRKPNDNAFIERFNRTIQEECVTTYDPEHPSIHRKVLEYLAYYNDERLHLGLQCRTPLEMLQRS